MKVTLRKKKISKGRSSLYLDFYPALIDPETNKSTRREFLKLFIYDRPNTPFEKEHNKETKILAESIRSTRQLDVQRKNYDFIFKKTKDVDFLSFFKKLTNERWDSDGNHGNWLSAYNHLERFTNGSCTTADINLEFCENFKRFLQTTTSIKQIEKTITEQPGFLL